jgi:RNA polymerase sigma-70 factor (ECF subfamily)
LPPTATPDHPAPNVAPDEAGLVARARDGDEAAFRTLVERYQAQLAATVARMLGDGPEVQDVVQEAFIRFHGALDRFRGDAAIGTYLTRIAMNLALDTLKRRRRWTRRFVSRDAAADAGPAAGERPAPDRADAWSTTDLVRGALDRLKPEHRAVVVLRMIEGRSTRETAEALGVPEGTVMSRLSRALARMERDLRARLGDDPRTALD